MVYKVPTLSEKESEEKKQQQQQTTGYHENNGRCWQAHVWENKEIPGLNSSLKDTKKCNQS